MRWIFLTFLCVPLLALAESKETTQTCPGGDRAVTTPAPVKVEKVLEAMAAMKTTNNHPALELSAKVIGDVHDLFDTNKVKTKMEQFYTLLHVIAAALPKPEKGSDIVNLDAPTTREILLRAAVFTDPEIPKHIEAVSIDRSKPWEPRYTVTFGPQQTVIPLNKGKGFYLLQSGKCQHAEKLIFQKKFSVSLWKNHKRNTVAKNFEGVNLFGDFGSRGMFDVDINYVEFRAVEFHKGTPNGEVTVYVSREEFKKNKHNPMLRLVTKFVGDKSVQPIDW